MLEQQSSRGRISLEGRDGQHRESASRIRAGSHVQQRLERSGVRHGIAREVRGARLREALEIDSGIGQQLTRFGVLAVGDSKQLGPLGRIGLRVGSPAINCRITSTFPRRAAATSAVVPSFVLAPTDAPRSSSRRTFPASAVAHIRAVAPPTLDAFTSAPPSRRTRRDRATQTRRRASAQWRQLRRACSGPHPP